ncbi:Rad18-like recombination and DNA repair protein [Encephalitozoon intestinalis ATCC 50506]|uniref:Rad18-like recombination and DNA repair protein n=1 Tax=Encephalitozoon intestinalis (strain ATCC 50506) TaxID=876142 RepID=E0S7W2_ENCIT|nr:Rad18-like recombination and DNA repair protein [Encephalitozoon intestinalis ATCC 50506]ADM11797.1 Rad18-like recombination and DNA repair protein [Encephalitozoon intestinalis ATCC 50506]UTX45546.1 structural maintenance of chromosomes protein [Encephalitozoon intestinalis]
MSCEKFKKTIASIELIKFMCHDHLLINLRKPLTIVTGCNGSGKSAIMVAIGLVLGQRAYNLERGSCFRDMIKSGESNAVVRVVLENHRGFKREFFGGTIIIEKRIGLKSATSSIVNGERKVWSTRKEDLELVLEFFSLRFENPLNFLSQEQAKKFLNMTNAETLYELFMEGTEIAEICKLNDESMSSVDAMRKRINLVDEELKGIDKQIKDEEGRLEGIKSVKAMEKAILELEEEILWAKVNERKAQMEKCFEKFQSKQEEMDRDSERMEELTRVVKDAQEKLVSIEISEGEKKKSKDKRREEIDETIGKLRMKHREIGNDCEELKEARDFKKRIISDFEKQDGTVKNLLPQLEEKHKEAASEIESQNGILESLEERAKECRAKAREEEEMISERQGRIFHLRRQIEFYSKNDKNSFFGPNFPNVIDEISKTRFNGKIIGPIGFEVKLKEQKWSKAVSIVLNNFLSTFIIMDKRDKDILLRIFRKHKVDFPISTLSSKEPNVIKYRANEKYKTVLDILEVRSPFVINYLIITASIEQTILVEDRKEAYEIIRSRPASVECAYTKNGDKIRLVGGSMSDFVTRGVDRFYFENTREKLERCRAEMKNLVEGRIEKSWGKKLEEISNEMEKVREKIEGLQRTCKTLEIEMNQEKQIYNAQMEVVQNDDLYEETKSLENQISLLEKKQYEINKEIEILEKEYKEIKEHKVENTEKLRQEIYRKSAEVSSIERKMGVSRGEVVKLKEEHLKQVDLYNAEKGILLKSGKKEIESRTEDEVRREIVSIQAQIDMCKGIDDEEKALATVAHLKKAKKGKEDLLSEHNGKIEKTLENITARIAKRDFMRKEIANNAAKEFSRVTKARGYEGVLEFNHDKKRLDVKMKVDGETSVGSRSMLSGGERSFACVSLLLSLWPSLSCPIKILDEFDVFMDDLNRKQAIRLLLDFFQESGFQGILITPLGVEDLFEDFCDVIVLDKPGKGEWVER